MRALAASPTASPVRTWVAQEGETLLQHQWLFEAEDPAASTGVPYTASSARIRAVAQQSPVA